MQDELSFSDWDGASQRNGTPNLSDGLPEQLEVLDVGGPSIRPSLPPIATLHAGDQETEGSSEDEDEDEVSSDMEISEEEQEDDTSSQSSSDSSVSSRVSSGSQQVRRERPPEVIVIDSDEDDVLAPSHQNLNNTGGRARPLVIQRQMSLPARFGPEPQPSRSTTTRRPDRVANTNGGVGRSIGGTETRPRNTRAPASIPSAVPRLPAPGWQPISTVVLPRTSFGRARRILCPSDPAIPIVCVSMRGDIQFISQNTWSGFFSVICSFN